MEQGRSGEQAAVVLTALLEGFTNDGIIQGAFSILARTNLPTLIRRMDIVTFCAERRCSVIFNQRTFSDEEWFDLRSGQSARIRIEQPPEDITEHDIENLHFEDLVLLQRPTSDAWIKPPYDEIDSDQHISVELLPAIQVFEWYDTHFLLPAYIIPEPVLVPVVSTAWMQLPLWEPEIGGQNIWVYFDGSFQPTTGKAGIGIAIFVRSNHKWYQGGFFSALVPNASAYTAELHAAVIAVKALHDLLKTLMIFQAAPPEVWFCYDSLTVGNQLLGQWRCLQHPFLGRCARTLVELVEARFSVTCQGIHIRSHQGEPGNELVDTLANFAADGHVTHDFQSFFDHVLRKNFICAGEWIWILFSPEYADKWRNTKILLPAKPSTQPNEAFFPTKPCTDEDDITQTCNLSLVLATGNVLTLKGHSDTTGMCSSGPTRQESILSQLHDAKVTIFALQETRLRKLHTRQSSHFLLFVSPATAAGHYGIILGFSTRFSHGVLIDEHQQQTEIFFKQEHFSVIATDPRFLVLRVRTPILKCIVIAAHAPHTGADERDIISWWENLQSQIPCRYSDWPRILLADANARIGSFPSRHVGPWQAEMDSEKSEPFLHFLSTNDLWIPATFEHCQSGAGTTWRHSTGKWLRNDFVAIPLSWNCQLVKSFVSEDVDLSTVKEDHALAILEITTQETRTLVQKTRRQHKRAEYDIDQIYPSIFGKGYAVPWHVDVHTHAFELQQKILRQIPRVKKVNKPLKTHDVRTDLGTGTEKVLAQPDVGWHSHPTVHMA